MKGKGDKDQDGLVHLDELYEYVYQNVSREARKRGGAMQPVRKGSVKGQIILTQYETEAQKRARELQARAAELNARAVQAYRSGNFEDAGRLWKKTLALLPEDKTARRGLNALERKRREEQERQREIIERRQGALLSFYRERRLPGPEYNAGLSLLEKEAGELSEADKDRLSLLHSLTDGEISPENYLKSLALLKKGAGAPLPPVERPPAEKPAAEKPVVDRPPAPEPQPAKKFRSTPREDLSVEEVQIMLAQKGFFDSGWNASGRGFDNQYEVQQDGQVVFDRASGLAWQKSGSPNYMTYADAQKYIAQLNREKFAGFSDWRLPTLEEAMTLMEREKKNADLYIDPVFDQTQSWIWTADKPAGASLAWVVDFYVGNCPRYPSATTTCGQFAEENHHPRFYFLQR